LVDTDFIQTEKIHTNQAEAKFQQQSEYKKVKKRKKIFIDKSANGLVCSPIIIAFLLLAYITFAVRYIKIVVNNKCV
jgi:hypothetical protein